MSGAEQADLYRPDMVGQPSHGEGRGDGGQQDQRHRLRAARRGEAQVAAEGHHVHEGHGHGHAAAEARGRQQAHEHPRRHGQDRQILGGTLVRAARDRRGPHVEGAEEQERAGDDTVDHQRLAPADIGQQPAIDLRPDEARDRRADRDEGDGGAAATVEPALDIVHGRREGGRIAEQAERDRIAGIEGELAAAGGQPAAGKDRHAGDQERHPRARAIGQPAHQHAANAHEEEAQHVGHRRYGAPVAERGGDFLQPDDRQVDRAATQADAEHRHEGQPPGIGAVDPRAIQDSGHSRASAAAAADWASSAWSSSMVTVTLRSRPVKANGAS